MRAIIVALLLLSVAGLAHAQQINDQFFKPLDPVNQDAYGPGVHSDATGRSFHYEPQNSIFGPKTNNSQRIFGPVERDAYGPGVHMDQFGRAVVDRPGMP